MQNLVEHSGRIRGAEGDPREAFASYYGSGDPVWTASCESKPVLVAVEDDHDALEKISRELIKSYGEDYGIVVCEASAERGLESPRELEAAGEDVALVLADAWLAGASGTEFLSRAEYFIKAKLGLEGLRGAKEDGTDRDTQSRRARNGVLTNG
jgi:hypothetical protein